MNETAPARPRGPYLIRSPETWDLVRTQYIRGETAASLAARFGVSIDNLRKKATREGWTRKQHAIDTDAALRGALAAADAGEFHSPVEPLGRLPLPPEPEPLDPLYEAEEVAALALGAVARCLQTGRYADAERMGRLAESMNRLARHAAPEPDDERKNVWDEVDERPKRTDEELQTFLAERLDRLARRVLTREFPGHKIAIGLPNEDEPDADEPLRAAG